MEFLHFVLMTSFLMEISGGVMKCQLFSQATVTGMLLKKANLIYSIIISYLGLQMHFNAGQ